MEKSNKMPKTGSLEKWRCSVCEFDNLGLLLTCEMCDHPRVKDAKQLQKEKEKKESEVAKIQCPNKDCKASNSLTNDHCIMCMQSLFPSDEEQEEDKKDEKKIDMITCRKCLFENSPENMLCVNCQRKLVAKRIPSKSSRPKKAASRYRHGMKECPKCGTEVRIMDYATGETEDCMTCQLKEPFIIKKYLCIFCDKKLTLEESKQHDSICKQRKIFYSRGDNPTYDRCTDLQYQTMIYMQNKCQRLHYKKESSLVERIKKLGYTQKDLENLHHYIIHYAPIIIHMHVNTHFHYFVSDTHYRNQFETSMSSGSLSHSARNGWENRMFDKRHQHATGFERVKYGTMNFTNDPTGVRVCAGYGQSYFLLKPHVRDRCTITDMDSSSATSTLGTFRFIFHLLMKLSDGELKSAFEGSKGKEMLSSVIGAYKEIQIHGPVEFSKDIERVYISKPELKLGDAKTLLEQVKTFCSKHGIDYQLFDNSPALLPSVAGQVSAPSRMVGDSKELTEEDLKPPPPPAPPVFGGFAGFGFGAVPGLFSAPKPAAMPAGSFSFGFHSPFASHYAAIPKPPEKKKEYGVDYI